MVRMGLIDSKSSLLNDFRNASGKLPAWLDIEKLTRVDRFKIAYWDETHKNAPLDTEVQQKTRNILSLSRRERMVDWISKKVNIMMN